MLLKVKSKVLLMLLVGSVAVPFSAHAGGVTYKDGTKHIKLGGRIQLQFHQKDPDGKDATDSLFFRRFRPFIKGSIHEDWNGKFQWDMGKAEGDNEVSIKDAYMEYKGFSGMKVKIGNANFPFSRELLTSSKKQQLVDRTFVGDHNYGTPGRNLGVHLSGEAMEDSRITYGFSLTSASVDPDSKKLDFDTPVNKNDDFNEGWMAGGRIDFHPFGKLKMAQGDFDNKMKATISIAGFSWNNDGDNSTYTDETTGLDTNSGKKPDVDSVTGFELSAAIRTMGISVDAEYNSFSADLADASVTNGLYKNGTAELTNLAVEGGYMVMPEKLELVAGYESQDSDIYDDPWTRTSLGANLFFAKHDIKLQTTYRIGSNLKGVADSDENELFIQMQYVF